MAVAAAVTLTAMCLGAPLNKNLLLDMVQNNPGDDLGFQQTKYHNPSTQVSLGYDGLVTTGENSISLTCNYSNTVNGSWVFPPGSPSQAWLAAYTDMLQLWTARTTETGLGAFFFTDLIVFPKSIVSHPDYVDKLTTKGKIDFSKPLTKQLMIGQFQEMFEKFPNAAGVVVRTGETYVYENPYHIGNSPIDTVTGTTADKQKAWAEFITFLKVEICEKLGKIVLFRTWDNFDGWTSSSEYYLAVLNQVTPHEKLYISMKHTSGDFYRNMAFNRQIGVGQHAQIIEISCQRAYEGKGAFPNYIMNGVINGFEETPPGTIPKSVGDVYPSNPIVKGIWTWSRGDGWWGPYIKNNELWIDLHVAVISSWFKHNATLSEEAVFKNIACPYALPGADATSCSLLYNISILSATAMLNSHYCPEHPGKCWGFIRDDRLGGLSQIGSAIDWIIENKKVNESLANKEKSLEIWSQIASLTETLAERVSSSTGHTQRSVLFLRNSVKYGVTHAGIIASAWKIMLLGKQGGHDTEVAAEIENYDRLWAQYSTYRLYTEAMASIMHGYQFNLPGQNPPAFSDPNVPEFANRWANATNGMHYSINSFRKK
eukprot:TRINITY_DN14105_c3_g1_i1.p1 TRINITY_DN14105_c3_g1~~TRINITY_DN14105_c3_g1_i1.p1  ORF type:complete len:598 (+),score=85.70 TRINITY_DN14105_c3_g1_i1:85-1878(+)